MKGTLGNETLRRITGGNISPQDYEEAIFHVWREGKSEARANESYHFEANSPSELVALFDPESYNLPSFKSKINKLDLISLST